jgi:competence protein ComEC
MLTGDAPSNIEDYLIGRDGAKLKVDVLKAGHHGSKYSTDDLWLAALDPSIVVISAGKGNSYGHPAAETMTRIQNSGAEVFATLGQGAVTFQSNGKTVVKK